MTYKQNQASIKSKKPRAIYSPKQETHKLRVSQARWASQLNWSVNAMSAGLIASATFFFMVGQVNQGALATVGGVCSTAASHGRVKEMEREANNRLDRETKAQRRKPSPPK